MANLPTGLARTTPGHVAAHEVLHALHGGLPTGLTGAASRQTGGGDRGHLAAHTALKAWYDAANPGDPLPAVTDAATHTAAHELLHAWVNGMRTGTGASALGALLQSASGTFAGPNRTGTAASVLAAITQAASGAIAGGGSLTAPSAAYALGTDVGVPTGTSLTATSGLPSADASQSKTLTHPWGAEAASTRTFQVWQNRSWTNALSINPGSGGRYWFKNCRWSVSNASYAVFIDETHTRDDRMDPLVVFENCEFYGASSSSKAIQGGSCWVINSHATDAEDAWQGLYYSVAVRSNFISTTDTRTGDPHQDACQCVAWGGFHMAECWMESTYANASSALRIGCEFGTSSNIKVRSCTIKGGGYGLQVRGDSGADPKTVDGVEFIGNRWVSGSYGYGPTDFVEVSNITWTDNAYLSGGAVSY